MDAGLIRVKVIHLSSFLGHSCVDILSENVTLDRSTKFDADMISINVERVTVTSRSACRSRNLQPETLRTAAGAKSV